MKAEVAVKFLRVKPLVLQPVLPALEYQFVLGVLTAAQDSGSVPQHSQHSRVVNDVLHLLPGVVKIELGEPDLLCLGRSDGVHVGLGPEVVEPQSLVSPLESHRELRVIGGEDRVEAGDSVEANTGEDRQFGVTPLHLGRQELVVAGVKLYHSAVHLISEVLAVRLAVTSEQDKEISDLTGYFLTFAGGQYRVRHCR